MNHNQFVVKPSENLTIVPYIQIVEPFNIIIKGEADDETNTSRNDQSEKSVDE